MDFSYIAGFFDAEGTAYYFSQKNIKIGRFQFVNTNHLVLEEIKKFLNAGYIYIFTNYEHFGKKPIYRLNIYKKEDVIRIAKEILNFSLIKRKKLLELLNFLGISYDIQPTINWSYLAGLVDGDGSITIQPYYVSLNIISSDLEALNFIKDFLKVGNIYVNKNKENGKIVYNLRVKKLENLLPVLENIFSFSLLKKDDIERAINTIKEKMENSYFKLKWKISKEELEDLYLEKKMSIRQIARLYNVNFSTIQRWLKKFKIPIRNLSEADKLVKKKINKTKFICDYCKKEFLEYKSNRVQKHIFCSKNCFLLWRKMV